MLLANLLSVTITSEFKKEEDRKILNQICRTCGEKFKMYETVIYTKEYWPLYHLDCFKRYNEMDIALRMYQDDLKPHAFDYFRTPDSYIAHCIKKAIDRRESDRD